MTSDLGLDVIQWGVMVGVLLSEIILLAHAWRLTWRSDEETLKRLAIRFLADIVGRAKRGHSPDWVHYRSEIDRLFESRDERLRVQAAAALAIGLGGTMAALLATFLIHGGSPTAAAGPLIRGMGVALFGSFAGVGNHLLILLFLLPRAEHRFELDSQAVIDHLRSIELANPPVEMFTSTIQQELATLRESLNTEFASAFSTAITGFPQVVEELGGHMDRLADVVETHARNAESAMGGIQDFSRLVHESGEQLEPVVHLLAASSQNLLQMPEQLGTVLETGRNEWIDRLQEEQRQQRNELFSQVDLLSHTVAEIKAATTDLPERLVHQVKGLFADLGYELASRLSSHLQELREHLQADRDKLVDMTFQQWRNNVGEAVREVLQQTADQVEQRLSEPLQAVAQRLECVAESLPPFAEHLESAHAEWRQAHMDTILGWQQAAMQIERAAERLASGDASLNEAVVALTEGASQLERVARVTGDFETALGDVLKGVVDRHSQHLTPLHQEVGDMVAELRNSRGQFDGILAEQSAFIRNLIAQILGSTEGPTSKARS